MCKNVSQWWIRCGSQCTHSWSMIIVESWVFVFELKIFAIECLVYFFHASTCTRLRLSLSLSLTRRRVRTRAERKITQFAHKTPLSTKHCACVYLCILIKFLDSITWIYLLFPNLLSFFSSPDFSYYFQSIFFIAIIDLIVDERLSKMRKNCLFFNFFFHENYLWLTTAIAPVFKFQLIAPNSNKNLKLPNTHTHNNQLYHEICGNIKKATKK